MSYFCPTHHYHGDDLTGCPRCLADLYKGAYCAVCGSSYRHCNCKRASVVGTVDTADSKSAPPQAGEGSTPSARTVDPFSIPDSGVKHDAAKLRWDLLPVESTRAVVRVLQHGAKKYGSDDNWKRVDQGRRRYYAAALRHLFAWWCGEKQDPETGESHLAHVICCALFLMEIGGDQ